MARTFDGSNDQVNFGAADIVDTLRPWTALCYVRITGNVVDERQILIKMDSSYVGTMFIAATGDGVNNNKIFSLSVQSVTPYSESAANVLVVNTWKVIVTTFTGTPGDSPKIYSCTPGGTLTEVSYTTQTGGSGTPDDSPANLRLATRDSLDATFFAGGLAECALWNRVLSSTELNMLGLGYSALWIPQDLKFYCPVTGTSSPEPDLSGNGNTGTVTEAVQLAHPPVIYSLDTEEHEVQTTVYS